ncbi:hypothetical protein [Rummeliibacillus sp. SL167]|uniref:hypothetical protein n=1 Tax=Rummeliibacillus sp. SL167 TaxID=2579792 RepID=UPI0011B6F2AD|nr:hypothetical protein [Rummeliibacillus sp. SL167]
MGKKNLFFKSFVVFSLVFSIFIASSFDPYQNKEVSAKMQEQQEQVKDLLTKSDQFNEKFHGASRSIEKKLTVNTKKLIFDNKISLVTNGKLDFLNLDVKAGDENDIVYLPIVYKNVKTELNKSYFAIIFDKNGHLEYYAETKIIGDDVNYTADVEVYNNGDLAKKEHLKLEKEDFDLSSSNEEVANKGLTSFFQPVKASAGFWSEFNDCLASKGIAAWAITALSVACGFACASTAGVACIPCLLGAGLATEGVVSYCAFKVRAG